MERRVEISRTKLYEGEISEGLNGQREERGVRGNRIGREKRGKEREAERRREINVEEELANRGDKSRCFSGIYNVIRYVESKGYPRDKILIENVHKKR